MYPWPRVGSFPTLGLFGVTRGCPTFDALFLRGYGTGSFQGQSACFVFDWARLSGKYFRVAWWPTSAERPQPERRCLPRTRLRSFLWRMWDAPGNVERRLIPTSVSPPTNSKASEPSILHQRQARAPSQDRTPKKPGKAPRRQHRRASPFCPAECCPCNNGRIPRS